MAPLDEERTAQIINTYLDLSSLSLSGQQTSQLFSNVSWNGRTIQFFLFEAYKETKPETYTSDVTPQLIQRWSETAYYDYHAMTDSAIHHLYRDNALLHSNTLLALTRLMLLFPDAFQIKQENSTFTVAREHVPKGWFVFAESGAMKIMRSSNLSIVFAQPRGVFLRYMDDTLSQLNDNDRHALYGNLIQSTGQIGGGGHLFARLLATGMNSIHILQIYICSITYGTDENE